MNEAISRPPTYSATIPTTNETGNGGVATTTTRTILRIKRRRNETPIPCLRLEGLVSNTDAASNTAMMEDDPRREQESELCNMKNPKRQRSSAVLWKRFDPSDGNPTACGDVDIGNSSGIPGNAANGSQHEVSPSATVDMMSNEKYRIVDAMFLSTEEGGNEDGDDNLRSSKRRKLTLLDSSTIADGPPPNHPNSPGMPSSSPGRKKRGKALKVLDPLTRIVDDSLQEVLVGQKTVESHYRQLTTDPRFTMKDLRSQTKWMTWSLDGGTNLLHCCALWNDASVANELLQRFGGQGGHHSGGSGGSSSVRSALMEALDGDGRTPYEVAQLIGHNRVCEVLEVYGGDTSNYVYDIFYLDHDGLVKTRPNSDYNDNGEFEGMTAEDSPGITTAELTSGVGYWTPEGELVLETADHEQRRARSLSQETEADIDSNCEEYGANDYPDEEELGLDDGYGYHGGDPYDDPYRDDYASGGYRDDDDDDGYAEYDWEQDLH